ncbi:hypothetical protein VST7929_01898 [Vibrio stylophorae]|uniref:Invasion protein n=1 Tax=Vibrio stylophorae TaxID=659351 RepID=A0ABM8ZUM4_9VIBR|nr:SirB2 family protein [Vibrio stylophorae]CAH0534016.1 hypothetical protein VST7929_01898 [Vibrio stylophorae]
MISIMHYSHIILVILSVSLFTFRFSTLLVPSLARQPWQQHRMMKMLPRAVDTLLIVTGLMLMLSLQINPLAPEHRWLLEKFTCLFAYIALGVMAMNQARGRLFRTFCGLGALGWVVMAVTLSLTKQSYLFG